MDKQKVQKQRKIKWLSLSNDPDIHVRAVLPQDNDATVKDKQRKMFVVGQSACLTIDFEDTWLRLFAPKGYKYDGATIPFKIGKGDMKLLIPALFHDILCDNKYLVHYDRHLSSEIFYRALLLCHVNRFLAWIMFVAVDFYQRFMDWNKK